MEVNHAVAIDVHLCLKGTHEARRHRIANGHTHILNRVLFSDFVLTLGGRFIPLLAPDLELLLILCADLVCKVAHLELAGVPHDDTNVVTELLVRDQVVTVTIHLIESLDDVDGLNARSYQRPTDLMSFQAAELRALRLEHMPKWLHAIVVQSSWLYVFSRCLHELVP